MKIIFNSMKMFVKYMKLSEVTNVGRGFYVMVYTLCMDGKSLFRVSCVYVTWCRALGKKLVGPKECSVPAV